MPSCCNHRKTWPVAAAVVAAAALTAAGVLLWVPRAAADDNPSGRIISEILPVGNHVHTAEQIRQVMHARPGIAYEEAAIQEDVRRLNSTKWFTPGGIQILTVKEPDGRVRVIVKVSELNGVVQDIVFLGAQHGVGDLPKLCGVRKGEPMNPMANEMGRVAILRKYQDDGRYFATVELVEGKKPGDTRVVYQIVEGPKVKVAGIDFYGVDKASTARLRQQLVTKKQFAGIMGGQFNPASMEVDRQKLIEYYEALGYLDVQVTPEVVQTDDVSHVRVAYHIAEGSQYRVAGKQINGVKSYPEDKIEALADEMKPGDRYDRRLTEANKARIKYFYGNRGNNVAVEERRYADPNQPGVVQVHYDVLNDGGVPDRVGRVTIEGNTVTRDSVILNQLDLRPGQVLQYPAVEDARMRLARLGIFDPEDPPTVEVVQNEFDSPLKDIRVKVRETRTGSFMLGGSFNTNQGVTGNITLNERNFDILRFPTSLEDFRQGRAFRGGGQEFRLEAAPGTQFQRYSATWRQPYLFDTPFGLTVSGYYFQRGYAEYNEERVGGRFTLDRRLDAIWRASVTARIEGVGINGIPPDAPASISEDYGNHFLFGVRPGVTRDTRDSYVYPTTGSVFDAGFEQVLGDYTFPVGTVEYTKFLSNKWLAREDGSGKHVLGLRTQVSVAGSNTPVFERFYGGGIRSFRGFTFRGMGPFENGYAVGGTFAWLNTVEYQIPIMANDKFHFVTFCDHGTVERSFEIRNYRVAVGAGLRLNIPALGPLPLAIDLGFPLNKGPFDKGQTVNISVGVFGSQ
ncbi:outer membrane protein assembly factor BamA [Gemmata sp.]|uniref:outer membrane protein assembly factor BamA n=1 Tax=Gemmata sp. TaxID=1914242 RepID=UPI003F6E5168